MKSLREIGEENDVSHKTISYWFEKFDIPKRGVGGELPWVPVRTMPENSQSSGYFRWVTHVYDDNGDRKKHYINVHRLVAVAEHGVDAVNGMDVHHENGIKWDNRPENLELMEPGEHTKKHHEQGDYDGNEFWKESPNYKNDT